MADEKTIDNQKEATSLKSYLPESFVKIYQKNREALGIPAVTTDSGLVILGMVFIVLGMVMVQAAYSLIMSIVYLVGNGFTGNLNTMREAVMFSLFIAFVVGIIMYFSLIKPYAKKNDIQLAQNFADSLKVKIKEGFKSGAPPPLPSTNTMTLLNCQSVAVKQVGYIGPAEDEGIFDADIGISSAIKTGIRFFIFQIDYLDNPKGGDFDKPGVATLLYRDSAGTLISKNGATIKSMATSLARYAFAPNFTDHDKPIVIYLHFIRTPNPVRKPEDYVKFLSSVAVSLEPLFPNIVGSIPEGNFQRQQGEDALLNLPLSSIKQKVIYMSNADTSVFRNLQTLGMKPFETKADLDILVNIRVFANKKSNALGLVSQVAAGLVVPSAILVTLNDILSGDRDEFMMKYKGKYVIVLPDQSSNPDISAIKTLLTDVGVNAIALNLFDTDTDTLQKKMGVWNDQPFYNLKPKAFVTINPQ
jgi:hypothetical protein